MNRDPRRLPVVVNGRNVAEVAFDAAAVAPLVFVHVADLTWNLTPPEALALADALRQGAEGARQ